MTMATKTFRGEGDLMVDALVAASQAAYANPNGGQPMPGFGRDLVPFFDDLGQEAGAANGAPAPAPAPQAQKKAKAPKPNKGGKKTAAVPAPKGVLTKGGMTYVQQQPNAAVAQAARTAGKSAAPAPSSNTRWAGPAFSNSPAPDALPVPSFMGGKAPAGSTALTGDAGADIMKMLGQEPPRAEAANAGHAASAPDPMAAMLNIVPEPGRRARRAGAAALAAHAPGHLGAGGEGCRERRSATHSRHARRDGGRRWRGRGAGYREARGDGAATRGARPRRRQNPRRLQRRRPRTFSVYCRNWRAPRETTRDLANHKTYRDGPLLSRDGTVARPVPTPKDKHEPPAENSATRMISGDDPGDAESNGARIVPRTRTHTFKRRRARSRRSRRRDLPGDHFFLLVPRAGLPQSLSREASATRTTFLTAPSRKPKTTSTSRTKNDTCIDRCDAADQTATDP